MKERKLSLLVEPVSHKDYDRLNSENSNDLQTILSRNNDLIKRNAKAFRNLTEALKSGDDDTTTSRASFLSGVRRQFKVGGSYGYRDIFVELSEDDSLWISNRELGTHTY